MDQSSECITSGVTTAPSRSLSGPIHDATSWESSVLSKTVGLWLSERAIDPTVALALGVRSTDEFIMYPRRDLETGQKLGYKYRSIVGNRVYTMPSGISMSSIFPFMYVRPTEKPSNHLLIVEGETDLMALASSPVLRGTSYEVMCAPGATSFPRSWVSLIHHGAVTVIPDGDQAGEKLISKVASLVPRARWARIPEGTDVNEMLINGQHKELIDAIATALPYDRPVSVRARSSQVIDSRHREKLTELVYRDTKLHRRAGELYGKCPFHSYGDERTASLAVNDELGYFYCHACGAGGDAVSYLTLKGFPVRDAINYLKEMR